jgi:hypothetical protein
MENERTPKLLIRHEAAEGVIDILILFAFLV